MSMSGNAIHIQPLPDKSSAANCGSCQGQKIYRLQGLKLRLATATFNGKEWFVHNRAEA
jgi:hypothetical protein